MKTSLDLNPAAWQYACDKANATAQAAHDSAESRKPEKERVDFVPQAWEDYAQARIADIEASYLAQQDGEEEAAILAKLREMPRDARAKAVAQLAE